MANVNHYPRNPCSYKGEHTAHDWQAAGGYYAYYCPGLDELDVGATARQQELIAEREVIQAGMPVVNVPATHPVCCRRCCASYIRDSDDDGLCSRCREED